MSTAKSVREYIQTKELGEPFVPSELLHLGTRKSIDLELARLVKTGELMRATRGVYLRPKNNKYVGLVPPEAKQIAIAKVGTEVEIHGAEAARRFGFTTQVPVQTVFYSTGPSKTIKFGNATIFIKHISSRKLVMAGTNVGAAFSALWYLGKNEVESETFQVIKEKLTQSEYEQFKNSINSMPGWMADTFRSFELNLKYA